MSNTQTASSRAACIRKDIAPVLGQIRALCEELGYSPVGFTTLLVDRMTKKSDAEVLAIAQRIRKMRRR